LISVIIATKNEEANIARISTSIKNQTYTNIEIIVVDNNSTDATKEIARKYTSNVYNKGPERSAQRNYGVQKSKGMYVLILDADMELQKDVVASGVDVFVKTHHKALVVPEKTVGDSFLSKVRAFERAMYVGDSTIEVARFFDRKVFNEFGGYDTALTGAEDYDLPHRISKKYTIGRATDWVLHHEQQLTHFKQLKKKYYYASKSALYAKKHPELVATQGNMLFRRAYVRHWRSFLIHPVLGMSFVIIRIAEATAAVLGYISAVGVREFVRTLISMKGNIV